VETEKGLELEIAEEVRAAIARAVPSPLPEPQGEETAPDPVRRAEAYLAPSIPEGAPLAAFKRVLLRVFRFLWRNQAAFNVLSLEAFRRGRHESQVEFRGLRERLEAIAREVSESRRRAAIQDARFALLEAPVKRAEAPGGPSVATPSPELPPAVYGLFEERFRGDPSVISQNQHFYLSFLRGCPGPVLDVGCGRGEFLRLLRQESISAAGVESNPISARLCREAGLEVESGDALAILAGRPKQSLGAIVALQVVEHWPAAVIFCFLVEARRVLRPDGVLIAETINTDSLASLRAFFLDPTHVRPVPPAALGFLAEAAGFTEARVEYRAPLPPGERLAEETPNDAKLNRLLYGPQDYALIARVPGA
jgi:SAM-dependent methyltransferase